MVKKSDLLTKSMHPKSLNSVKPHCRPTQPCPKCALVLVIRYRFDAFREQFGREPKPTEPLFFEPSKSRPVKASLCDAREQIEAAAAAVGIKAAPVLQFLRLDSPISEEKADRIGRDPAQPVTSGARSGVPVNRGAANRCQPRLGSAWDGLQEMSGCTDFTTSPAKN